MNYLVCLSAALVLLANFTAADPNPLCPYPSEHFTRAPYQGDCTKYWECYDGQRYSRSCPDGLEYNSKTGVCDFPELANCDSDVTVTYPTYPPYTTTTPGPTSEPDPDNICTNVADGTFLADPDDCQKFYECLYGKAIIGICPTDEYWNEDTLTCDYAENVVCNN